MKKFIAPALAALIVLTAALPSCSNNTGAKNGDAQAPGTAAAQTEASDPRLAVSDGLPDEDYGGYSFRVSLENSDTTKFVYSGELDGEVVNDAVYSAGKKVEERFNVKITPVYYKDNSTIKTTILAGDDAYDIVTGHDISMANISLEGVFRNVYDIPHLDFDKPWWPKNTVESLTVNGDQMYLFSNCISYQSLYATRVIYANKEKMQSYGIDVPYKNVFDGTWTLDMLIGIAKDVYSDVNGNSKRDNDDFYGYINSTDAYYCYLESFGIETTLKDKTAVLKINTDSARTIELIDKLYTLLLESPGGYLTDKYADVIDMFKNGKAMFIFRDLGFSASDLKEADFDYGMLPMPKLDESQSEYIAGYTDRPYAIPMTVTDEDRTGVIIEAMSAEGYRQVIPAFYEIALKQKYTYDNESVKILDLITDVRVLDFWYIYGGYSNENMCWVLTSLLNKNNPSKDYASYYAKMSGVHQARIDKVIAAFEKMK